MSSVFTKIVNREIPAEIVYEDDKTLAFLDIRPVSSGHTLVIPKEEVDELQDLDEETYRAVMDTALKVSRLLKDRLQPARVGVVVYGFDVPHAHVHLIPMDGPGKISMQHGKEATAEELAAVKAQLAT